MKNLKKYAITLTLIISCVLTACSKSESDPADTGEAGGNDTFDSSQSVPSNEEKGSDNSISTDEVFEHPEDISDMNILFSPSDSSQINHDNPRIDYTKEEAAELINKMPNLTASDKLHIYAPKSIDHVSTFYLGGIEPLPFEEGVENFKSAFSYLFPGHEFDYDCFFYNGGSSVIEFEYDDKGNDIGYKKYFNKINDKYEQLASGEEEMMLFIYSEELTDKKDRVNLVARSPFGNDISIVNKGVANRIAAGNDTTKVDEQFSPGSYFKFVKDCDPDSEEKVKLLDGEISVKDAVAFYENYINNIPYYYGDPNCTVSVNLVEIYSVNKDLDCLFFITSPEYDSIPFGGVESYATGEIKQRNNLHMGLGHMISTNDVDGFYGAFKCEPVTEETQYKEHVSLERALEIISEEMTQHIDFKVESIRFVYCFNDSLNGYDFDDVKHPVYPSWKVELYNENDGLEYTCYVNALSEDYECLYLIR